MFEQHGTLEATPSTNLTRSLAQKYRKHRRCLEQKLTNEAFGCKWTKSATFLIELEFATRLDEYEKCLSL